MESYWLDELPLIAGQDDDLIAWLAPLLAQDATVRRAAVREILRRGALVTPLWPERGADSAPVLSLAEGAPAPCCTLEPFEVVSFRDPDLYVWYVGHYHGRAPALRAERLRALLRAGHAVADDAVPPPDDPTNWESRPILTERGLWFWAG